MKFREWVEKFEHWAVKIDGDAEMLDDWVGKQKLEEERMKKFGDWIEEQEGKFEHWAAKFDNKADDFGDEPEKFYEWLAEHLDQFENWEEKPEKNISF